MIFRFPVVSELAQAPRQLLLTWTALTDNAARREQARTLRLRLKTGRNTTTPLSASKLAHYAHDNAARREQARTLRLQLKTGRNTTTPQGASKLAHYAYN